MANVRKQQKITKMFRKGFLVSREPRENDHDELEEEVQKLEQRLKEIHNELFQLQRNSYRQKLSPMTSKTNLFVRPQKIMLQNSIESLRRRFDVMSMLTGIEVQSYKANDYCCIVYHMQHDTPHQLKHGLRIEMKSGINEVSKSSLPPGFNFNDVVKEFKDIMMPDCLCAIRKALVAYYNRLQQYEALKKMLSTEVQLFKILDSSHIEMSFHAKNVLNEEDNEQIIVELTLSYRPNDILPKAYFIRELDLPEGVVETLRRQCAVFKKKPLKKAFKEAFINGVGPYNMERQFGPSRQNDHQPRRQNFRPNRHDYNNDDTFHPEDCSDDSDGECE